jgi:hypothetical protein
MSLSKITRRQMLVTSVSASVAAAANAISKTANKRLSTSGAILHPQTAAEISASITPTNFNIPSHLVTNGIFHPERYGANTAPGITPMSAVIQSAISVATAAGGGEVQLADTNYFLGTTAITVPSNIRLSMKKGGQITVNSAVPANMPQAYISITGSSVEIDGCLGYIAANPFSTYATKGAFIGFGASNISNIKIHDCDATWFMHGIFGSWIARAVANNVSNVVIERNRFTSYATDIIHTGLSPLNWAIRNNTNETVSHTASNNGGAIQIMPGVILANADRFTQSAYDIGYGQAIIIANNSLNASLDRPIRVINCQQVECVGNNLSLGVGSFFVDNTKYCGDAVAFDFCRKLSCHNNSIRGGGENAIDILSCQDFECHDNNITQCNTAGIFVFLSDLWNASTTSPKLASITTRTDIQTQHGNIHDNYIEAFDCMQMAAGQNILWHGNRCKPFKSSTYWISGNTPGLMVLDNTFGAAYFAESPANWEHDVSFFGNKPVLVGPVSVTYSSRTNLFTTVGGVSHGFVTGDRVKRVASGTSTTVDYPSGLNYQLDYYVVLVSATTFKLATTSVNAFAGTHNSLGTNGLSVSGSALLVREQTWPAVININPSYYTRAQHISLDENLGSVSIR